MRSLLQIGIFPTQGSNPGLLHCRRILYQLSWRNAYNQPAAVFSNAAARFKNPRRIFHPSLLTQSHLQHNIIVCVTSHHLFHITQRSQGTDFTSPLPYSIGQKQVTGPALTQVEGLTQKYGYWEMGNHWGSPQGLLSHRTICICLVFKVFVMIKKFGKLEHLTG